MSFLFFFLFLLIPGGGKCSLLPPPLADAHATDAVCKLIQRHFYHSRCFIRRFDVASQSSSRLNIYSWCAGSYFPFSRALDNQTPRPYYRLSGRTLTSSIALSLAYTLAFVDLLLAVSPPLTPFSHSLPHSLFLPLLPALRKSYGPCPKDPGVTPLARRSKRRP